MLIMSNKFDEFCKKYGTNAGDELLERICDAHWNGKGGGIHFSDIYQHDSCNHTLSGSIKYQGEEFHFIIHNGNLNGCQVVQFGTIDDVGIYKPPPPSKFMFVPKDDGLEFDNPTMYKVYQDWTKTEWFQEKLRNYHYDRHFQPGGTTEKYYREWADKKGMKIVALPQEEG